MKQIGEIAGAIFTIAMVVGMWAIGCMLGCIPILVGLWLWRMLF